MPASVAIIGGSGLESLPAEFTVEPIEVMTPFGQVPVTRARRAGEDLVFLPRHGARHDIAPHEIDYQANIAALVELGVERVLATNAVGSLRGDLAPRSLVLLDDFIDFTSARKRSFWDDHPNRPEGVVHTDFSHPYCQELRLAVSTAAQAAGVPLVDSGTYVCADGPRYESPAEIRAFARWGGDLIGMTGLPEAVFAREAGLCYAAIAIVTNYGAGISKAAIAHGDVMRAMGQPAAIVRELLLQAAAAVPAERACTCGR